ncbi:MAG: hypothetical protein AB2814_09590, partial [Candidatus Sedimenticola endophacoides]
PIMRLKSRYIMHLEHYPFQKPPTNFSDEAFRNTMCRQTPGTQQSLCEYRKIRLMGRWFGMALPCEEEYLNEF